MSGKKKLNPLELKENNVNYITPILGETVNLNNYTNYQEEWWKEIK